MQLTGSLRDLTTTKPSAPSCGKSHTLANVWVTKPQFLNIKTLVIDMSFFGHFVRCISFSLSSLSSLGPIAYGHLYTKSDRNYLSIFYLTPLYIANKNKRYKYHWLSHAVLVIHTHEVSGKSNLKWNAWHKHCGINMLTVLIIDNS